MDKSLFYRGHHIVAKAVEHVFGKWCWTYTIDEQASYSAHGIFHASKGSALEAAIENARMRVDRLPDNGLPEQS
ncbi:hypothetical protein [Cupriavidus pauculus]|uniref:Uncharacterized protein n=1 Tax=Cupriavidus pauculus TaxID=82633 RepID=A0A2N5CA96_9BURK|nr:hypothetical protein [Cupriavidus pauculus]PLP99137.1 hypothetical protein CYJ10_17715 [Cupriavidus pauculus]